MFVAKGYIAKLVSFYLRVRAFVRDELPGLNPTVNLPVSWTSSYYYIYVTTSKRVVANTSFKEGGFDPRATIGWLVKRESVGQPCEVTFTGETYNTRNS